MKYHLDTNICVYLMNNRYPHLKEKFLACNRDDIGISSVVYYELRHGIEKSIQRDRSAQILRTFLHDIQLVSFDGQSAEIAGKIRAELERKGQIIGGNDILIAATSLANSAILVTNNMHEFERVDGLLLENWV